MTWLRRGGLQYRIAAGVILGLMLMLAGFGYLTDRVVSQVQDLALQERLAIADGVARTLDAQLAHMMEELTGLASPETLLMAGVSLEGERAQVERLQPILTDFAVIERLSPSGTVLWSVPADASRLGSSIAARGDVAEAMVTGRTAAQIAPSGSSPSSVAHLAAPIKDESGSIAGFLTGELGLSNVRASHLLRTTAGAEVQIVDAAGRALAGAEHEPAGWVDAHAALVMTLIARHESGVVTHDPDADGPSHSVAYAPLGFLPGGILLEDSADPILTIPADMRTTMLLFGVLAVLVGSAAAWFHARRVVKPLRDLTVFSARIASGSLEDPVLSKREDEVGVLAQSFDAMRLKLKNSQEERDKWEDQLERKIGQRTADVERRNRELAALNHVLMSVSQSPRLTGVLDAAVERLLDICAGDAGLIYVLDQDTDVLSLEVQRGLPRDAVQRTGSKNLEHDRSRMMIDTEGGLTTDQAAPEASEFPPVIRVPEFQSMMAAPLRSHETSLGTIYMAARPAGHFAERDLELLRSVAGIVGVAVENARLSRAVQEKANLRAQVLNEIISAQEEERKRIARELHDGTIQSLAALLMKVQAAIDHPRRPAGAARTALTYVQGEVGQTIADLRRAIVDLRPLALDDLGLVDAVRWYAQTRLEAQGIDAQVLVSGDPHLLPEAVSTSVFRITQEAINNVAQHSKAKRARLEIRFAAGEMTVLVEDDGVGFIELGSAGRTPRAFALGILGMKERAAALGGVVTITAHPGQGTRVEVTIPLRAERVKP